VQSGQKILFLDRWKNVYTFHLENDAAYVVKSKWIPSKNASILNKMSILEQAPGYVTVWHTACFVMIYRPSLMDLSTRGLFPF
jgi:hypothetical protein